jgi:putative transposase
VLDRGSSALIDFLHPSPWRTIEDVELATLGWVHWWNTTRLLEPIGNIPPAEFESNFAAAHKTDRSVARRAS